MRMLSLESFNRSTGWVQGTQVFLHIDPPLAACTGEAGADGGEDAKGEVGGMAGARDRGDEDARVLITVGLLAAPINPSGAQQD